MKKISTLAFLVATAFPAIYAVEPVPVPVKLVSAPSREISATNTEIILETPEGTLVDPLYSISENSYFIYSSALVSMSTNGYAGAMVRTDDAIYVRNMISQFDQSSNKVICLSANDPTLRSFTISFSSSLPNNNGDLRSCCLQLLFTLDLLLFA